MISYVLMKAFESAPKRYDWGMKFISLGSINKVRKNIVENFIAPGDRVLDVGCGTGTLAIMIAEKGATVDGFDMSEGMLEIAEARIRSSDLDNSVRLMTLGVTEMETAFQDESYDKIISTLVFSELSKDEQIYTLRESKRLLKRKGLLIIADEVPPGSILGRGIHFLIRLPLAILTFIFAQAITHSIKRLEENIRSVGFAVISSERWSLGSLEVVIAEKDG